MFVYLYEISPSTWQPSARFSFNAGQDTSSLVCWPDLKYHFKCVSNALQVLDAIKAIRDLQPSELRFFLL